MLGLVLEGGGAKGSYHAGVIKALYENGYRFDGVAGTSIGAINGALIAQGDYEKCYKMWEEINPSDFIDVDDEMIERLLGEKDKSKDTMLYLFSLLKKAWDNRGLSTNKILPFLRQYIDENKLRESKTDYCIITVSISDRQPMELFKEDIPYGSLHDYILASAYFPAFRLDPIEGKRYIDGGLFDNLPINPLIRKGYNEIIAIRTMSKMPHRKVVDETVKVQYIHPYEKIGGTMSVNRASLESNLKRGYMDGLRFVKGYEGELYYFEADAEECVKTYIDSLGDACIEKFAELFNQKSYTRDSVLKELFVAVKKFRKVYIVNDYYSFLMYLEGMAKLYGVEQFVLYKFDDFYKELKKAFDAAPDYVQPKRVSIFDSLKEKIFDVLMKYS